MHITSIGIDLVFTTDGLLVFAQVFINADG